MKFSILIFSLFASYLLYLLSSIYGNDFKGYESYFNCIITTDCINSYKTEVLTDLLASLFSFIPIDNFIIFFYIFIGLYLKILCFSYNNNFKYTIFLYAMCGVLILEFNQIRASVAIAIVVWAIYYLRSGNKLIFIALIIFSSLFHISSLIFLILLFPTSLIVLVYIAILIFISNDLSSLLTTIKTITTDGLYDFFRLDNLNSYLNKQSNHSVVNVKTLGMMIFTFLIINYRYIKKKIVINLYVLYGISIFGLFIYPELFSRVSDMFLLILLINLSWSISNSNFLFFFLLTLYAVLYFISGLKSIIFTY